MLLSETNVNAVIMHQPLATPHEVGMVVLDCEVVDSNRGLQRHPLEGSHHAIAAIGLLYVHPRLEVARGHPASLLGIERMRRCSLDRIAAYGHIFQHFDVMHKYGRYLLIIL